MTTSNHDRPSSHNNRFGPYFIKGKWLMKDNPKEGGDPISIGHYVIVRENRRDIDTGKITLVLEYDYLGQTLTLERSRGVLTRSKILTLLEHGVDVTDHKVNDVLMFLNRSESSAPLVSVHSNIGWGQFEEATIFKAWKAIGCESTYCGSLDLEPKGTLNAWTALVREHVLGNTQMELALTLGLAAPVNTVISRYTALETILVHIHGDSSQGKSTATRVAVSPFGLPHTSTGGLIKTWNGTRNAILGHFRDNFGIPMALDEASMHGSQDFSSLIYALAAGSDKSRMNKDGEMLTSAEWSGVILSNAEHSLQNKAGQNIGIRMRLIELGNVRWTDSAQHADALKEGVLQNYGQAGPAFVEYLLQMGDERIKECWESWQRRCLDLMSEEDRFSSRMADKFAVFLSTAEMAKDALNLDLNVEAILEFLLQVNREASDARDIGQNAMRCLMDAVTRHHRNFDVNPESATRYERWGKLENRSGRLHMIVILPSKLDEILREGGFEDTTVVLRNWKAKGWLDCDENKLTRKRVLHKPIGRVSVYCIRVDADAEPTPSDGVQSPRQRKVGSPKRLPRGVDVVFGQ